MSSAPLGRWVVVRSDRLILSVDKADHVYHVGRRRQLPSPQLLSHKYASREQLAIVWHPPHLFVAQVGTNPSFLGPTCEAVPRLPENDSEDGGASGVSAAALVQQAALRFTPSASASEVSITTATGGVREVAVPLCDPLTVTQAPDRGAVTAATLHFPEELGLPSLTVRFESTDVSAREDATAAATTKSTAEMLAVPTLRNLAADESDEDGEGSGGVVARGSRSGTGSGVAGGRESVEGGEEKPEWRGLLDVALQEQQRQEAMRVSEGRKSEGATPPPPPQPTAAAARKTPVAPPPPPSSSVPFGGSQPSQPASPPGGSAAVAGAAAPVTASPHHRMGFWEWNNHAKGSTDDPTAWRKYNQAVAELLEKAYTKPSVATVKIPNSAMFDRVGATGATYGVCFAEKSLKGAMIQYVLDDPRRFRLVRRTGGSPVDRTKAKKAQVIPSASDSESEEESDSDSDSEESVTSSSSSESEEAPKKRPRRR